MPRDKLALEIGKKARAAAKDILAAVLAESGLTSERLFGLTRHISCSGPRQALALLLYRDTAMSYVSIAKWLEPHQSGERKIRRHVISDGARSAQSRVNAGHRATIEFIERVEARYQKKVPETAPLAA